MTPIEWARLLILGIGWPLLLLGSARLALQARRFYLGVGASSYGRLAVTLVAGLLVTMYALGVTATAFMILQPHLGVPIVFPIFAGWFILMLFVVTSLGRWTDEVSQITSVHLRLAEANRARADLINRASHELSTPLTPLLIQAELLSDPELGPLTAQQRHSLEILRRNLDRLAALVRDMMDVARLQTGHLELVRAHVDLSDTLREAFDAFKPAAQRAGLYYDQDIEDKLWVEADPLRIAQVVQNLIHNAVLHTPKGGTVRVVARARDGHAEAWVEDTGVGFDPARQEKLFEPFAQLGTGPVSGRGLGMGLYIAKTVVEGHGGAIWARSEGPGLGTTIGFKLPVVPRTKEPKGPMERVREERVAAA